MYDKIKKINDCPYSEYFETRRNILTSINPKENTKPIDVINEQDSFIIVP